MHLHVTYLVESVVQPLWSQMIKFGAGVYLFMSLMHLHANVCVTIMWCYDVEWIILLWYPFMCLLHLHVKVYLCVGMMLHDHIDKCWLRMYCFQLYCWNKRNLLLVCMQDATKTRPSIDHRLRGELWAVLPAVPLPWCVDRRDDDAVQRSSVLEAVHA